VTREALVALLATHRPADEKEAADLERMRAWAISLEAPFSREQPEAHFTASAVVTDEAVEQTLLVHHRKSGSWFQPGGHFEPEDVSAAEAAMREAREETGLAVRLGRPEPFDVDIHWVPWDEHFHLDLRYHVLASGQLAPDAAEVHAAEWLTWDEAFGRITELPLRRALLKVSGRASTL
jgi:8-oxo-dGTP pyrophosphatase MutT (NUDIX family)